MRTPILAAAALSLLAQAPQAPYRTLNDRFPPPPVTSRADWDVRAAHLREHVLASAGLLPLPSKCPLNPVVFDERRSADYTVSKVYFESLPGFYVTGNLYRPAGDGPFPAVLSPHGHWTYGRLENSPLVSGPGRAISLARQGFVVFTHDMIGYNDSRQLPHTFDDRRARLWGLSLAGLQVWNGIRALDFLQSLPYVRGDAIGVTGESGGGTQTFLLAAADDRVAAAVPVNMISLRMQGGCLCENPPGLRLDTTNVEIAATIAPRPLLMISATGDWTSETLESEYPAVRALYALVGAEDRVSAARFTADHNYNQDSREAMYAWMARWLKQAPAGTRVPERPFTPNSLPDLLVFHGRQLPDRALTPETLTAAWIDAARAQLAATPLAVRGAALRHALAFDGRPAPPASPDRGRRRPAVVLAGDTPAVAAGLRAAGYTVRAVAFTPFDAAAAAKVGHFETYNRTPASQRVADIVGALGANPGAILVAAGDEALAAILASAIEPPRMAILDVDGFETTQDGSFLERLYIPGLRRAGDLQTASELAAGRLIVHSAGAGFAATGARVQQSRLTTEEILSLVRRAARNAQSGLVTPGRVGLLADKTRRAAEGVLEPVVGSRLRAPGAGSGFKTVRRVAASGAAPPAPQAPPTYTWPGRRLWRGPHRGSRDGVPWVGLLADRTRRAAAVALVTAPQVTAQTRAPGEIDDFAGKPRVLVLTDMGNEPDDQMSFVRLLLYSNEMDLEGLVATTSTWQKQAVHPETMRAIVAAFAKVRPNLLLHAEGWPEPAALDAMVTTGQPAYGMAAVGLDKTSPGAEAIVRAADRPDQRPLWITIWGGANTLAQALAHVRATRQAPEVNTFVRKLRIYSISDQDDAGPWIRREFPGLFYVVKPSSPDSGEYGSATWTGISGDVYYRNCAGADSSLVTNEWLDRNVRGKGPLGRLYPRFAFIMEGDTPSFLGLTDNGLRSFRNPSWGGWGGRYVFRQPYGETHPIWTQGGDLFGRVTSQDAVAGADGKAHVSDQATIWRWRAAFQNEFAARMDWTVEPFAGANHAPVATVNGDAGKAPLTLDAKVGVPIALDAGLSRDPDKDALSFAWFHYEEAGFVPGQGMAAITIAAGDTPRAVVTATAACRPAWLPSPRACPAGIAHIILAVTDAGSPPLTSYRRIILRVSD